ncbi:MAG: FliH/SctL family protein [Verrucomicrobiota bacterium]
MNQWPPEKIQLTQPLRDVRRAWHGAGDSDFEGRLRDREQVAYERGRQDGERMLSEQLVAQRSELLELQRGVFESLRNAVPQVVHDCENALVSLAMEVAQKLVAGLPVSSEMVEGAVQEALSQVEESTEFNVYLHPDDLDTLKRANSPLLSLHGGGERTHFHNSNDVSRGGCLVQTRFGVIDGRRETKFEALKKSLLQ